MQSNSATLVVIAGPTAVGKTAVGVHLAQKFSTEIVSADSRQIYKEMSIGTAVPSFSELQTIKHHFIQSHTLDDNVTVGGYERECLLLLNQLFQNNRIVFMVGGSGLFVKAVTSGLDDLPQVPKELREKLNLEFEKNGLTSLFQQLKELDAEYADIVDKNNPQRVIRALEVCLHTNKPFSSFRKNQQANRPFKILKIGLDIKREELYANINHRVDVMFEQGLEEEARRLYIRREHYALKTVGYKELFDYFDGEITLNRAKELIKQNTRRFAKRQLTWFGADEEYKWFNPKELDEMVEHIQSVC